MFWDFFETFLKIFDNSYLNPSKKVWKTLFPARVIIMILSMIIIYCLSSSAKTGSPKGQGELWENFGIALGEVRESSPRALPRPLEKHFWSKRFPRALPELSQSSPSAVPDPLEKHFWRKRFSIDLPELSQSSPRALPARFFFSPRSQKYEIHTF